jgi:hypothetical protein
MVNVLRESSQASVANNAFEERCKSVIPIDKKLPPGMNRAL